MDGADTVILPQMRLAFKTFIVTELPQLLRDAGNKGYHLIGNGERRLVASHDRALLSWGV